MSLEKTGETIFKVLGITLASAFVLVIIVSVSGGIIKMMSGTPWWAKLAVYSTMWTGIIAAILLHAGNKIERGIKIARHNQKIQRFIERVGNFVKQRWPNR